MYVQITISSPTNILMHQITWVAKVLISSCRKYYTLPLHTDNADFEELLHKASRWWSLALPLDCGFFFFFLFRFLLEGFWFSLAVTIVDEWLWVGVGLPRSRDSLLENGRIKRLWNGRLGFLEDGPSEMVASGVYTFDF